MTGRLIRFPQFNASKEAAVQAARRILALDEHSRGQNRSDLEEAEVFLEMTGLVRELLHSDPVAGKREAEYFYTFLHTSVATVGLFDEHDYFVGEFALLAGVGCRLLSLRDEARLWFDRAEAAYRNTVNAVADLSRLAYQRLALRMEERQAEAVLELTPSLVLSFQKLGMKEDEIKARFLRGLALMESDRLADAVREFDEIVPMAVSLNSDRLVAQAYANLTQIHGLLGDTEQAIESSRRAMPVLERLGDRSSVAKTRWGLANLLRRRGEADIAIQAYRLAQREFESLGMRADVAALNLVIADLQLEVGEEKEAISLVLAALPVLDELKMVPEETAAMALLQESVRHNTVNRTALRELHGYFDEVQGR